MQRASQIRNIFIGSFKACCYLGEKKAWLCLFVQYIALYSISYKNLEMCAILHCPCKQTNILGKVLEYLISRLHNILLIKSLN